MTTTAQLGGSYIGADLSADLAAARRQEVRGPADGEDDRDRSPRGLRKGRRPLFDPRREDRLGIALDVHAGRASVESTWLSATIAARRVRMA